MYFSPNKYMAEIRSLRKELEEAQKKWRDGKLRKLFKNPISERWGKQICLN